ncbi:MAG: hypothetical protein ACKVXR_03040 [Planctomycetota bacterium]
MEITDLSGTGIPGGVLVVFAITWATLAFLVHVAFAIAVYRDAEQVQRPRARLMFVNPFTWALTALISSVAGVALYWALHHSTLRTPVAVDGIDPMKNS